MLCQRIACRLAAGDVAETEADLAWAFGHLRSRLPAGGFLVIMSCGPLIALQVHSAVKRGTKRWSHARSFRVVTPGGPLSKPRLLKTGWYCGPCPATAAQRDGKWIRPRNPSHRSIFVQSSGAGSGPISFGCLKSLSLEPGFRRDAAEMCNVMPAPSRNGGARQSTIGFASVTPVAPPRAGQCPRGFAGSDQCIHLRARVATVRQIFISPWETAPCRS
jgi:hypothetical protein